MAEAKNNFIKSKMNKDLDERLIPNNEYRDALNLQVAKSDSDDVGSLEAILGNAVVSSGSGYIIGHCVDEQNGLVYLFRTNYTAAPDILPGDLDTDYGMKIDVYNKSSNQTQTLVQGNFLNFSTVNHIYATNLVENLLFWTDNRNTPRKINVDKTLGYYTNEDQISVAKFTPYSPPEFINLRSVITPSAATHPSTMSDAADPPTVTIGLTTISSVNLAVKNYRNGDPILQAQSTSAWTDANNNSTGAWCYYDDDFGNGVTYGILYNKWAVLDSRKLAPVGFEVASLAQWDNVLDNSGTSGSTPYTGAGVTLKEQGTEHWNDSGSPTDLGTNLLGFSARGAGFRDDPTGNDFTQIKQVATFWTSDAADDSFIKMTYNSADVTVEPAVAGTPKRDGRSVRVVKNTGYNGWNGDPEFLKDKFAKFSYRFKYDDNEYSAPAPFSQDVFIPQQEGRFVNEDENEAFISTVVEFMQNSVNNAVLNIKLPSTDIITDYKIKGIDILFKESDKQSYSVLDSVVVDSDFISDLNYTNIYQYTYESLLPVKTLPMDQTTRVFDRVPLTALAQESAGNRIMYSNFTTRFGTPLGLDYYAQVADKDLQDYTEYPNHSLKQNRNYQAGIILADKYGRQTDIILSSRDDQLDASGNPIPGSNVYSRYKPLSFADDVENWRGDNLNLVFDSMIPEAANAANTTNDYPGAYAIGAYYEVLDDGTEAGKYFWDNSNQSITASASQTVFDFLGITYDDIGQTGNTFEVYKNESTNGWTKLTLTTDYTVVDNGNDEPRVTLTSGATAGVVYKARLLYTTANLNKYQTGQYVNGDPDLIANFASVYTDYYKAGRKLKGLYCDYTEITSVSTIGDPVRGVTFFTKDEVAETYLFNESAVTRLEPALAYDKTFATYRINPKGFYTYRVGVKQTEQEYYNVYLPGILNGYPIVDSTIEQGKTSFITLIKDNVNKVPRNLQDVGPTQDVFTSDEQMWGRVVNVPQVVSANPTGNRTYNRQYFPTNSPDQVDQIATTTDLFPDLATVTPPAAPTTDKYNYRCVYDGKGFDQPLIAKISTQAPIGEIESTWTTPGSGTNNPYPGSMSLAVYETKPVTVPFELYYESSTAELISELNNSIQGANTAINGMSSPTVSFTENLPVDSQITTDIFPTISGLNYTGATGELIEVFPFLPNANFDGPNGIDTTTNFAVTGDGAGGPRFTYSSAQVGSIFIKTGDTFYYGANGNGVDVGLGNAYAGVFRYKIRWTDSGVTYDVTDTFELGSADPVIVTPAITNIVTPQTTYLFGSQGSITSGVPGAGVSPTSRNGSARPSDKTTYGNFVQFDIGAGQANQAWRLYEIQQTDVNAVTTTYTSQSDLDARFTIGLSGLTGNAGDADRKCGFNLRVNTALVAGNSYLLKFRCTDTTGNTVDTDVSFALAAATWTGSVIGLGYTSGTAAYLPNAGSSLTNLIGNSTYPNIKWSGQFQNWRTSGTKLVLRYKSFGSNGNQQAVVKLGNTNNGLASGKIGQLCNNTDTGLSPAGTQYSLDFETTYKYAIISPDVLAAFTGVTSTETANGLRPGMKNTAPPGTNPNISYPYDALDCAVVNWYLEVTTAPFASMAGNSYEISIMYCDVLVTNPNASNTFVITAAPGNDPPFYSGASAVAQTPTVLPITNV